MRSAFAALLVSAMVGCRPVAVAAVAIHGHSAIEVSDLPLVEIAPPHAGAPLAVLVSGDGGWRAIDRGIAEGLRARGYGVVGLVSPRFFSERKTPEEASRALRRILEHYRSKWRYGPVVVVGYSRGAGVVPFMINRLPLDLRRRIVEVALIGLEDTIDFQVSAIDLLRDRAPAERPVRAEVERLRGDRVLCFYGTDEYDSLCRRLRFPGLTRLPEPGGHHYAGNIDDLARVIWAAARN